MRPDFGRRLLSRGNLLFLLDGLDEAADLAQRMEVSGWVEEALPLSGDQRGIRPIYGGDGV